MTILNEVFTSECAEAQLGKRNRYSPGFAYFRQRLAGIIISGFDTQAGISETGEEVVEYIPKISKSL